MRKNFQWLSYHPPYQRWPLDLRRAEGQPLAKKSQSVKCTSPKVRMNQQHHGQRRKGALGAPVSSGPSGWKDSKGWLLTLFILLDIHTTGARLLSGLAILFFWFFLPLFPALVAPVSAHLPTLEAWKSSYFPFLHDPHPKSRSCQLCLLKSSHLREFPLWCSGNQFD